MRPWKTTKATSYHWQATTGVLHSRSALTYQRMRFGRMSILVWTGSLASEGQRESLWWWFVVGAKIYKGSMNTLKSWSKMATLLEGCWRGRSPCWSQQWQSNIKLLSMQAWWWISHYIMHKLPHPSTAMQAPIAGTCELPIEVVESGDKTRTPDHT